MTDTPVADALAAFRASGSPWLALPFFAGGAGRRGGGPGRRADRGGRPGAAGPGPDLPGAGRDAAAGGPRGDPRAGSLPDPGRRQRPRLLVRGSGRLPASLKVILAEAGSDRAAGGDLTPWARQGVLLLNSALTVEAGKAGAHLRFGWAALTDEAVAAVSARPEPAVFLLWGAQARARAALIDAARHGVFESGHPSPLNRARDFPGSDPFGRANRWLAEHGSRPIDWRLG